MHIIKSNCTEICNSFLTNSSIIWFDFYPLSKFTMNCIWFWSKLINIFPWYYQRLRKVFITYTKMHSIHHSYLPLLDKAPNYLVGCVIQKRIAYQWSEQSKFINIHLFGFMLNDMAYSIPFIKYWFSGQIKAFPA